MTALPATEIAADEAALRARLEALGTAWAQGDAAAYASFFAPHAQYIVFDGTQMNGRDEIAAGHKPLFERWLRGSRLLWSDVSISFPLPDVAIIHSRGAVLKRAQKQPSRGRRSVQTIVAVRRDGHWTLEAFHNTRDRPFAQTLLGKLLKG
ncbi:MAG TPA: SgcJ/EcaC family oxidoreductase [Polyangiales bacterium]|nr:SgcJ/EcaC family oxidoreductase [Polyangiales bacterium]